MKSISFLLIILLVATGCNKNDDNQIICTTEFVYGLNVTLKNSDTDQFVTSDVEVKIKDGNYEETLMTLEGSNSFFGAGERPGNYIITVTSSNYFPYISQPIMVLNDQCHVITKNIEIELSPN